jgi:hypothetical protein
MSHHRRTSLCLTLLTICSVVLPAGFAHAQSRSNPPDLNGTWGPYRGGRGADPKLAPPPATPLAIKPQYVKAYEAQRAADAAAQSRGEQIATGAITCMPYGVPAMMSVAVYPLEIIQTPKQITMVQEAFSEVRRVYLNKPQFPIDEVPPGYHGRSVGKWEGDTLVIDTVGIKPSVQYQRIPHSDRMRITERIRMIAPDILHDQITIEDPVTLEKPYTFTLAYRRMPDDYEMVEFVCAENNREYVDEQGIVRMRVLDK